MKYSKYDSDSSEDEDGGAPSYDAAASEETPKTAVHHPYFLYAQQKHEEIIQILQAPLNKTTYTDTNVTRLKEMVEKRKESRSADEIRIAVTGVRKNIQGDSGQSETLVVHEFRRARPDQTVPFRAEVEFYTGAELEEIIATEFKQAYAAVAPSGENASEMGDTDDDTDIPDAFEHIQAISNLFCNQRECASLVATTEFLRQARDENDKRIIDCMIRWSKEIVTTHTRNNSGSVVIVQSTTSADLLQKIRRHTFTIVKEGDNQGREAPCWPIVKKITFCLNVPLLNDGIVLVTARAQRWFGRSSKNAGTISS